MGPCTGTTTVANSPFGAYAAENLVKVTFFSKITNLNAVPFTLELFNGEPDDFFAGAFDLALHFFGVPASEADDYSLLAAASGIFGAVSGLVSGLVSGAVSEAVSGAVSGAVSCASLQQKKLE